MMTMIRSDLVSHLPGRLAAAASPRMVAGLLFLALSGTALAQPGKTTEEAAPAERYDILINTTRLSIPGPFIWNRDLRRDGEVGSINLFMVMPEMTALPEDGGPDTANGFGPVILANITSLEVDSTAAELFASFAEDGYWSVGEIDLARDGLQRLSGRMSEEGQGRWYAIVEDGTVDVLLNCMTDAVAPYPSCTAHGQIWDELALRVNFDAERLAGFDGWWQAFAERLGEFRTEGGALDL